MAGRRVDGTDLALVGLFTYASLLAGRNLGPFALVTAPVLSRHVAAILARLGWLGRLRASRPARPVWGAINVALLVLVAGLTVAKICVPLGPALDSYEQQGSLPVDAAAWILANRPAGEMFNPYNWGGYLIWTLWPDYRVFVDGRTDLYGDALLTDYVRVQYARPGYEEVLAEHGIGFILTYKDDVLSTHLACTEGWERAYEGGDGVAEIWIRREVSE